MHVDRYADPAAFLSATLATGMPSAAMVAFLHAWVDGVQRAAALSRTFMATAQDDRFRGFALQRDDWPAVLGCCTRDAALAFADALADDFPALPRVVGGDEAAAAFSDRWASHVGGVPRVLHRMRNHVLTRLRPPPAVDGATREASEADEAWLRVHVRAFAHEAGVAMSEAAVERQVRERLAERAYRIWTTRHGDRAFAGFSLAGREAARVAPVYTLPEARGRGYAGALVGALCAELLAQRSQVFLVTDLANPTANALYARLGFEPLDDTVTYALRADA